MDVEGQIVKEPVLELVFGTAAALLATPAFGQVVHETDTKALAGLLDSNWNPADSFTFFSQGNEILFADLDAELFQVKGRRGGSHEDDEGDCGGHETTVVASSSASAITPYLLNWSLRRVATDGRLQSEGARSSP